MAARGLGRKNIGMLLLAIWLIIQGASPLLGFSFPSQGLVLSILALAAGILILLDR